MATLQAPTSANEYLLENPPSDGITNVVFAKSANTLLVSSWDSRVRLYDVNLNMMRHSYAHEAGVLDCCFGFDDRTAFSGGLDCDVKSCDFDTMHERVLGGHSAAVRCIRCSPETGLVVSGSWDMTLKTWDPKKKDSLAQNVELPEKVFAMDSFDYRVVVAMNNRLVYVYDLRQMNSPVQKRESPLKFQTRCIRVSPDHSGFAVSSIEGRAAVEYLDPAPEVQAKKFAFKCHRQRVESIDTAFPVNALAFHPIYGTFATGGGDGMVYIWDGINKKRLCQFHKYSSSISSLAFDSSGDLLAIAVSYTFEQGDQEHPPDTILIRKVSALETQPKEQERPPK